MSPGRADFHGSARSHKQAVRLPTAPAVAAEGVCVNAKEE